MPDDVEFRKLLRQVFARSAESLIGRLVAAALAPPVIAVLIARSGGYFVKSHAIYGWAVVATVSLMSLLIVLAFSQRRRIRALTPEGTAVITTHQTNRPFWTRTKLPSGEDAVHARCEWYVKNSGSDPIAIVGGYTGQCHGMVETFSRPDPGGLVTSIEPKKTAEIACDFWISPPPVEAGQPLEREIVLVDDLGGIYRKRVRFDYDSSPIRQFASTKEDVLRREFLNRPELGERERSDP